MSTFCRTTLNYLPGAGLPGAGQGQTEVVIRDRRVARLPGWRECGFELVRHSSEIIDWMDDAEISAVHYPEIEELARKMTGAELALVSGHIRRSPEQAQRHEQLSPHQLRTFGLCRRPR